MGIPLSGRFRVGLFVTLACVAACGAAVSRLSAAQALETPSLKTHGVVKSFGPGRTFVNIAHDKIPGYMEAMTMSFEPRTPEQVAGIAVGDSIDFSFTETDDGRRLLDSVTRK